MRSRERQATFPLSLTCKKRENFQVDGAPGSLKLYV